MAYIDSAAIARITHLWRATGCPRSALESAIERITKSMRKRIEDFEDEDLVAMVWLNADDESKAIDVWQMAKRVNMTTHQLRLGLRKVTDSYRDLHLVARKRNPRDAIKPTLNVLGRPETWADDVEHVLDVGGAPTVVSDPRLVATWVGAAVQVVARRWTGRTPMTRHIARKTGASFRLLSEYRQNLEGALSR